MIQTSTLRARARGRRAWATYSDEDLQLVRRLVSRTRSAANRVTWRAAMQSRTSRVAGLLRSLVTLVLTPTVTRTKGAAGWLITAIGSEDVSHTALEIVTRVAARTLKEFADPIVVRVHRRDLVDLARLRKLELTGKVAVVFAEGAS